MGNLFMMTILIVLVFVQGLILWRVRKASKREIESLNKSLTISSMANRNFRCLSALLVKDMVIKDVLKSANIERIAVYGMGNVGKELVQFFAIFGVSICYGIDKKSLDIPELGIELRKPEEVSSDVDIIIVSSEYYFDDIERELRTKVSVPIVLASQFLEELLRVPKNYEAVV